MTLRDIVLFSLLASLKQSLRDRGILKIKNIKALDRQLEIQCYNADTEEIHVSQKLFWKMNMTSTLIFRDTHNTNMEVMHVM